MIRFFRTLRQRLLAENRFRRYLMYALGEVLLVVIGILIALQVNNWNSDRLQKASSRRYLAKLTHELDLMVQDYNNRRPFVETSLQEAREALRYLESCGADSQHASAFNQTMVTHQTLMKFTEIRNTYDEMIATGAFSGIDDTRVKSQVFRAYNILAAAQEQINYFRDEVGRASAIINSHVTFSFDKDGNLTVAYEIKDICNNIPFRNAVVEIIDARGDWLVSLSFISSGIQDALEAVQSEIDIQTNP